LGVIILVSTCAVGPHARAVMICALHLCNTLCSIPHLTWQSTQRIHRNTHIRPSSPFRRGTTLTSDRRLHSAAVQHSHPTVVSIPPRYNTHIRPSSPFRRGTTLARIATVFASLQGLHTLTGKTLRTFWRQRASW
jgi:hypothetical protein